MKYKGVSYDVGRVMWGNWRPEFDVKVVNRELEIIRNDLHCNAVRICGLDIGRLTTAAELALKQGLHVLLSPEMWEKSPQKTLDYIIRASQAAEALRQRWPEHLMLSVGSELTLFMQGVIEGRNITKRMGYPSFWENAKAGTHNKPLNAFLARATEAVRRVFHGRLTYASLIWEAVDWSLFDVIGVDHYRDACIKDRYAEMLEPLLARGKPVFITEFGMRSYKGAESSGGALGFGIADSKSLFLHQLPVVGRFVRPRLRGDYVRDDAMQAREVVETLGILEAAGVDGAFIMTFVEPLNVYDQDPRHDLDMNSFALVKSFAGGRRGTTYPGMAWEPKELFRGVADFYARR